MRCPDCNKFVSHEVEANVDSLEIDDEGHVTGEVTLTMTCAECSTELATATSAIDTDCSEAVEHLGENEACGANPGDRFAISEDDFSVEDSYHPPDRPMRYQRHLYHALVSATITCLNCTEMLDVEIQSEPVAGGEFEPY